MDLFFVDPAHGVWIGNELYCKTPEGLRYGLTELRTFGYLVEGRRNFSQSAGERTRQELSREHLWTAELPGIELAQCLSCNGIISRRSVAVPHRHCEFCDAPTMTPAAGGSHVKNYKPVMFWRGKVYDDGPQRPFPYPGQVKVYEAWHWPPHPRRDGLVRQLCRIAGSLDPDRQAIARMNLYVEHFTTINTAEWSEFIAGLRTNLRWVEMYEAVTAFCHRQ